MPLDNDYVCREPSHAVLLESALRSFFAVFVTHILAGEVDTDFAGGNLASKLSWLIKYFNPVNLCWRYYSMLAFRTTCKSWGDRQLALINFEAYPYRPPIPYIRGEKLENLRIRRLEISGLVSSQGLLSLVAAYQGVMAIQFIVSSAEFGFLPTVSKPLAILGLFRVMLSNWIASKLYVEPYPYPEPGDQEIDEYRANKLVAFGWLAVLLCLVMLSIWPYIGNPAIRSVKRNYVDLSMEMLYQYTTLSVLLFHIALLMQGPFALANRILYFDHWLYKLQSLGFIILILGAFGAGLADFVLHDFYRYCM